MRAENNVIRLITVLTCALFCQGLFISARAQDESQKEAQQLWEKAITAKGGRDRLYAVHNAVIIQRGELIVNLFKRTPTLQESLFVFPNKVWTWNDMRPSVFGLTVDMRNYDTHQQYLLPYPLTPNPHTITDEPPVGSLMYGMLIYLPETKWLKPVLVKVSVGKIGFRRVDVVQTAVNGNRVDFALNQKTHLPVRVSYYDVVRGKTYITADDLSDYVESSGIKVPRTIRCDYCNEYKETIQFNVEYNEDIFIKPLPIEAGPEAWKKVRR